MTFPRTEPKILTVGELTSYLRGLLDGDPFLADVWVRGEISNFRHHTPSGHMYFTLKDAATQIRAVMFRGDNLGLAFRPAGGLKVIARGRVSVYERDGQYQLYVRELQPDGLGSLYLAFEQLKQKLAAEGLFDASRKRALPLVPRGIGVVTSLTGAALRDIITVTRRRFPNMAIIISPAQVQGTGAPADIIRALDLLDARDDVDVILLARGGGSLEELWAFNDESLARAIRACRHPVVSGVGHETDITIADLVADCRAATPSNAAEVAVPEKAELAHRLGTLRGRLERGTRIAISERARRLEAARRAAVLLYPERALDPRRQRVDDLSEKLAAAGRNRVTSLALRRDALTGRLHALSPLAVLGRGYALCRRRADGRLVRSVTGVSSGEALEVQVEDGLIDCEVSAVRARVPGPGR